MKTPEKMKPAEIDIKMAEEVLKHHFGKKPKDLDEIQSGLNNAVFEGTVDGQKYIVRMSDIPTRINYFQKEQWAVQEARERGVPTPEVLEVGNEIVPFPYTISCKAEGMPAIDHPDRAGVLRQMGEYAATINSIPTDGYGHVFDWSHNTLSKNETWKDFIEGEWAIPISLKIFHEHKIFPRETLKRLKEQVEKMTKWKEPPSLNHSDMRLKNILVNEEGKITAILDWDDAKSAIAPYWELSLALHDLTIDEKHAFLEGYGMSDAEFRDISWGVKLINILNYAETTQWFADDKDEKGLEMYRTRLNGHLDLYSL